MARIAIKIGTSVLSVDNNRPDDIALSQLVEGIAAIHAAGNEVFIITSGAIVWGHAVTGWNADFHVEEPSAVRRASQRHLLREQLLAAVGQPAMTAAYASLLSRHGANIAQILITRQDMADQSRYESIRSVAINLLLSRVIPLFNENDVLSSEEIAFSDNDQLACMLATALQADRLIILTNVDGLFDRPPELTGSQLIREVANIDDLHVAVAQGRSRIGTGGMKSKLEAARLATSFGIEMMLANGKRRRILQEIVLDEKPYGTLFLPRGVRLKQRKGWMALAAGSRGELTVSSFLAESLAARKPASILVIGVEQVEGDFQRNDIVTVKDVRGRVLGRGEVRMSSQEVREKIQRRRDGEETELYGSEVIHCDYFVHTP